MKISRRTALQTCSAVSASAVMATGLAETSRKASQNTDLARCLEAAIDQCRQLQKNSRNSATVNAQWNLLATHAGNCQRIATVICGRLKEEADPSPANVQACADSCTQLIMTTHVLAEKQADSAINCLIQCKNACLHWLAMKLA